MALLVCGVHRLPHLPNAFPAGGCSRSKESGTGRGTPRSTGRFFCHQKCVGKAERNGPHKTRTATTPIRLCIGRNATVKNGPDSARTSGHCGSAPPRKGPLLSGRRSLPQGLWLKPQRGRRVESAPAGRRPAHACNRLRRGEEGAPVKKNASPCPALPPCRPSANAQAAGTPCAYSSASRIRTRTACSMSSSTAYS